MMTYFPTDFLALSRSWPMLWQFYTSVVEIGRKIWKARLMVYILRKMIQLTVLVVFFASKALVLSADELPNDKLRIQCFAVTPGEGKSKGTLVVLEQQQMSYIDNLGKTIPQGGTEFLRDIESQRVTTPFIEFGVNIYEIPKEAEMTKEFADTVILENTGPEKNSIEYHGVKEGGQLGHFRIMRRNFEFVLKLPDGQLLAIGGRQKNIHSTAFYNPSTDYGVVLNCLEFGTVPQRSN